MKGMDVSFGNTATLFSLSLITEKWYTEEVYFLLHINISFDSSLRFCKWQGRCYFRETFSLLRYTSLTVAYNAWLKTTWRIVCYYQEKKGWNFSNQANLEQTGWSRCATDLFCASLLSDRPADMGHSLRRLHRGKLQQLQVIPLILLNFPHAWSLRGHERSAKEAR